MKLPEQIQFQGSAESKGFRPVVQASPTELIDSEATKHLENQQRNLARHHENLTAVEKSKVDSFNNGFKNLAAFSQTIATKLEEDKKKRDEQEMQEGLNMAYMDGFNPEAIAQFDAEEAQLKRTDDGVQAVADQAQAGGAPFMGVQKVRQLSGWKQYGYAMGRAQLAGGGYAAAMSLALAELPLDATSADRAAALAVARGRYMSEQGLVGMNPLLLNKYAFPTMREADMVMMGKWQQADVKRQQDIMLDETLSTYEADPVNNFNSSIDGLVRSGLYTRQDARKVLLERIQDVDVLDSIGGQLSWDGKKTWAEKYPFEFDQARDRALRGEIDDDNLRRQELAQEGKAWFDQVQELWEQNPPSDEEIEEARRYMEDEFDAPDTRLDRWTRRSTNAADKQYWVDHLDQLDRSGRLTEADLKDPSIPRELYDQYIGEVQKRDQALRDTPEVKQFEAQIKADLDRRVGLDALGNPRNAQGTELAKARALSQFQRVFAEQLKGGADAGTAATNAYAAFRANYDLDKFGVYAFDDVDGFTQVIPSGASGEWEKHKHAITGAIKAKGMGSLSSDRLIPAPLLEEAVRNSPNPNYQPPPIALWIADTLGGTVTPWQVLDMQAQAQGLGSIARPPAVQAAETGLSPEFQRLLQYRPSARRVSRAMMSSGTFNPGLVPYGYGPSIQRAAAKYKIHPGLLAGILEVESNFNAKAYNKSGATGIAQIIPRWHPNVDATNAEASIDYAAKYLSELQGQLGSIDEAIYGYNSGPGAIRKSAENRAYYPKVMRAAAKYGYGAPGGMPWVSPTALNPRVAYITGNIGPTSTGAHLDVKREDGGNFSTNALDRYVEVDDKELGRVPLSRVPVTNTFDQHVARGSHGIDYGTYSGSKVYLRGGARVVGSKRTEHGDKLTIQLPNGQRYTFLHGKKA